MRTLLLGGVAALAAFLGIFAGFYWWQFHELPSLRDAAQFTNKQAAPLPSPSGTPTTTVPTTSSQSEVLGASQEYVLPSTLYGLINGQRRDIGAGVLTVNTALEATAQRLILIRETEQRDPAELAKSLGFSGSEVVTTQVRSESSAWDAFTQLQADQRADLLIKSKTFTDIGAALICDDSQDPACTTVVILGTR